MMKTSMTMVLLLYAVSVAAAETRTVRLEIYDASTGQKQKLDGKVSASVTATGMPVSLSFANGKPICSQFLLDFSTDQRASFTTKCGGKRYRGNAFFSSAANNVAAKLKKFEAKLTSGKSYISIKAP